VKKVFGLSFSRVVSWKVNGKLLLVAGASGIPILFVRTIIPFSPYLILVFSCILYPVCYFILGVKGNVIEKKEIDALANWIRSKLSFFSVLRNFK
jgi:hypothetical protein